MLDQVGNGRKYTHYLQDGRLSMTADERSGKVAEYIYLQGRLLAVRERDVATNVYTTKYQHTDALGSPVAITNQSRGGLERTDYEPYGWPANRAWRDGPGYTGHVEDAATQLTYMQQRYYDPQLGVFLSVDPVAAYENPVSMFNRYRYAANSPYSFIDPDGRAFKVSGDTTNFAKEASDLTGMKVTVGGDGLVSAAGDANNPAASALTNAINAKEMVERNIVNNDKSVIIDQYQTSKIDIGDISKMKKVSFELGQAGLTHVLSEALRLAKGERYLPAHYAANRDEAAVFGAAYREDNLSSSLRSAFGWDIKFTYKSSYHTTVREFSFDPDFFGKIE